MFRAFLASCCLAWTLAGCAGWRSAAQSTPAAAPIAPAPAPLVLVSLDGFHPDWLDPAATPHLARLAREGVFAPMRPSYPTLTFPNHYTLVTGLRPDRHGIVHNTMHDAELGAFAISDQDAVGDGRWWADAEPLWVTAEKAGLRTATYFWPGSEAAVHGIRPWRWKRYDGGVPTQARVDEVLAWLDAPAPARPRFVTLYFGMVDEAVHDHGPDSTQARAAIAAVDAALGRLVAGLETRGLLDAVHLVVVSDHGMAAVPPTQVLALEDMVDPAVAEWVTYGQVLGFAPRAGREAAAEAALLGTHRGYACWRREALPARWHYGTHRRVPPIVCQMEEGWGALPRARLAQRSATVRGSHGYDPALVSMRALFVARGPALRAGATLPVFDNVHVYPLLARLLGVAPVAGDWDRCVLAGALREPVTGCGH